MTQTGGAPPQETAYYELDPDTGEPYRIVPGQ